MSNVNGLQKICDVLAKNPSWSVGHLVAYFNLSDYVRNEKFVEFMDFPEHDTNMTPLQLAVQTGNIEMVKLLLPICKVDHLDNNSNGIFHYAATSTREIINLVASHSTTMLNHCNSDGFTALHLSCVSDKPDCVKALLCAGADVNIDAQNGRSKYPTTAAPKSSTVADIMHLNSDKLNTEDMKRGGTPLHWSASREVLEALIERGTNINALNLDGKTALHIMVMRNRLDCAVALLSNGAEIDWRDKEGKTPLHIAVEKKLVPIVQCLVVFGCDINAANNQGHTPRHMLGGKGGNGQSSDMILYILHSVGAKRCGVEATKSVCSAGCTFNGDFNGIPPEAPESHEAREHIQQMLASTSTSTQRPKLSGNAKSPSSSSSTAVSDVTKEELTGQTIMDTLMGMFTRVAKAEAAPGGAKKESPTSPMIVGGDATIGSEPGTTPLDFEMVENSASPPPPLPRSSTSSPSSLKSNRGRLLCLDGGGIRGLVLVQMLLEIEKLSQTPIRNMFDWMAGTSTGGILALGMCSGKSMIELLGLYLRMKELTFVGGRPYQGETLEKLLKEYLGADTVMTEISHPKLMVTGVLADRKPVCLHLFRNYKCASDILGIETTVHKKRPAPDPPEKQLVWEAGRATGAAPSYFRAYKRFLDGGLIANNPTLDAMTEIHEYNMALRSVGREKEAVPVSVVLSLGTGLIPVTELKDLDVFRPDSIWSLGKVAFSIKDLLNLIVDQATESNGRVVDRARAWCSMIGVPYFRFNPQMSKDVPMDEKDDQSLINMMWETKAYMHQNRKKVIELINLLK